MGRLVPTLFAAALAVGCSQDLAPPRATPPSVTSDPAAPTAPAAPKGVQITRNVAYLSDGHAKHRLDVFAPGAANAAAVVHFIHGGYWVDGDKDAPHHGAGLYGSLGHALADRGIVAVIQSYRLAPEVGIEGMIDDVRAALGWSIEHAADHGGDPGRIFVMGHSAGGHLAAMMATHETLPIAGAICMSAIWDVADMRDKQPASFNDNVTIPVFGTGSDDVRHSPIHWIDANDPPIAILIGEHDFGYMIPQARLAHDAIAGSKLIQIAGYDHLDMIRKLDPIIDAVVDFSARR